MSRDSDRSKVYDAENELRYILKRQGTIEMHGTHIAIPDERKFSNVEDVQRFVDAVLDHIGEERVVTVRKRAGQRRAHYEPQARVIAVPVDDTWALRESVVLHEVAHHLTAVDAPDHGQEFRRNLCDLLEKVLAPEARYLLQVAFFERGLTV